jgi:hypothetical protein
MSEVSPVPFAQTAPAARSASRFDTIFSTFPTPASVLSILLRGQFAYVSGYLSHSNSSRLIAWNAAQLCHWEQVTDRDALLDPLAPSLQEHRDQGKSAGEFRLAEMMS